MFSLNLRHIHFQIKPNVTDTSASLVFFHKVEPFHGPKFIRKYKNQTLIRFCSRVNLELSAVAPRNGEEEPPIAVKLEKERSYAVSFLINSCGLSPETAISASEKVCFKNLEKPNLVLDLLERNGFSKTQIATAVRKRPGILLIEKKTLLPKLKFLQSIGISKDVLAKVVCTDPIILTRSLMNHIVPRYNFLKSVLLTDERVIAAVRRRPRIFIEGVGKRLASNIEVLREMKVPESCIRLLLSHFPRALMVHNDHLRESISEVSEMGFDPLKSNFVLALNAFSRGYNQVIWARCYEAYSEWGCSKDDIHMAFRKQPNCMLMSQKKIHSMMDFLVNKMGWDSKMILKTPTILVLSLENRIIPRCSVFKVLSLRGLIKKNPKVSTLLIPQERYFLERFVVKYEKEVPQLHDLYKGKVCIEELLR